MAIESGRTISGRFCAVNLYPQSKFGCKGADEDVSLTNLVHGHFFVNLGLCLPDSCSPGDVYNMVAELMKCHAFYIPDDLICDSAESNTFASKYATSHVLQRVSL